MSRTKSMMKRAFAAVLGSLVSAGLLAAPACDEAASPPSDEAPVFEPSPRADDFEIPFAARFTPDGVYRLDPGLPLPFERHPALGLSGPRRPDLLKADQYDNRRAAAPQNFAITRPPEHIDTIRPMVEWEPMQAIVFNYPSWAAQYAQTTSTFVNIAKVASDHGEVWVIVDSSSAETIFKQRLTAAGVPSSKFGQEIRFWRQTFDSYWLVDFGPLPLVDMASDTYAFADFRYYHERPADDAIPTLLGRNLTRFGAPNATTTYRMPLTTEGGTFQSTTDGICITSSRQLYNMSCLAGTCRESILELSLPALQTHQYTLEMKSVLALYAGCKDLIVTHSITDDGTGHIDMYLKILDDDRILVGTYQPPYSLTVQRDNARLMNENANFLAAYLRPDGRGFQVVRMPMPGHRRVEDFWGEYDVPFTYLNSTFFNGVNLWPAYTIAGWGASRDAAQAIWEQVLPDMEHVWIDSEELAYQSGAIHCVTRTIPRKAPGLWVEDGACADGVCAGPEGGYDGVCQIGLSGGLCFGPDWLCTCNDCRSCPESTGSGCGEVSWRGCCDEGDVLYCENGQLKMLPCGGIGCGWSQGDGFYNCGLEGEDPSGETAMTCSCTPQCDGRTCGEDGCGGTCGTCAGEELCVAGVCRSDCASCTPGEVGCDGQRSWLCEAGPEGCHTLSVVDCAANGLICRGGQCDSAPMPDPDPEPDASPDAGGGDVDPNDTSDASDPSGDAVEPEVRGPDAEADTVGPTPTEPSPPRAIADEGCGGGASGAGGAWLLALLGFVTLRRASRAL